VAQILYSERQIDLIRKAAQVVAECHRITQKMCVVDATTREIDQAIAAHIKSRNGTSPFLNYRLPGKIPFPNTVCSSVNDVVVHGVADDVPLKSGDLVSIDVGVRLNGYIGDSAWTFVVGETDEVGRRLMKCGRDALYAGIAAMKPGGILAEVSRTIQKVIEAEKFAVVRDYVGHGVGLSLHEEPQVPNYVQPGALIPGFRKILQPGMVLAIEPMVNEGTEKVISDAKLWPVHTADGGRSVHFEHTVAVMKDRVEILTAWDESLPAKRPLRNAAGDFLEG
jgi:methionyl aminopeptidase